MAKWRMLLRAEDPAPNPAFAGDPQRGAVVAEEAAAERGEQDEGEEVRAHVLN